MVMVLGLTVAASGWNNPRHPLQLRDAAAEAGLEALLGDGLGELMMPGVDGAVSLVEMVAERAAEPLQPLVRKVTEGDTIRAIAAEHSVDVVTILASNKIDDPDLIAAGQELLIPPLDGIVADVEPGETLGELAERFGVEAGEIALANALPSDPDVAVPYERLVVPGLEPAERTVAEPRRKQPTSVARAEAEAEAALSARLSGLTYEVQEGDTLSQLSAQFGVSTWTILTANNLGNADMLQPGASLKVPVVNGVEHEVQIGESLLDIATYYEVDLGSLLDFNALPNADSLKVGSKLTVPGAEKARPPTSLAAVAAPVINAAGPAVVTAPAGSRPVTGDSSVTVRAPSNPAPAAQRPRAPDVSASAPRQSAPSGSAAMAQAPASKPQASVAAPAQASAKPQVQTQSPAPNRLAAASITAPLPIAVPSGASSANVVGTAMKYLGSRYVFGGTSPSGFDCSGFMWYVYNAAGKGASRGLWGMMNGGPRVSQDQLQPGDAVFFANTYMPGLSHGGIYLGGGRFIHASDERSGVKISSLSEGYWGSRYIGASRLS